MDLLEKEWFIEAPWGRISIIAWGDCSDPPVLACHGSLDSAACFRPLVRLLPKKFYYIGLELPGNGKSDPYPPGMMISAYDFVFVINIVVTHFRWKTFDYMAHSLGTSIGAFYDLSYPGKISKVINLDPTTRALASPLDKYPEWYDYFFTRYYEKYDTFNAPTETGPVYGWKEAIDKLITHRGLTEVCAAATLERVSVPAGKGKIRYTLDQRMKIVNLPHITPETLKKTFTSIKTPTLAIIAKDSITEKRYIYASFMMDETQFPNKNYRFRIVEGNHDVHFIHPERLAGYVSQFLLHGARGLDVSSKL